MKNTEPIATDLVSKYTQIDNIVTVMMRGIVRKFKAIFKGGELLFGMCLFVTYISSKILVN